MPQTANQSSSLANEYMAGGGEVGALLREMDWSKSPLGPVENWPRALRTAIRIILTSRQPMFVWWGNELICIYNDAYRSILGKKHPWALGRPASEVWHEIWDQVGPRARSTMVKTEGTYDEAMLLILERNGYPEETYYTFSYSPLPDDEGGNGGIFCANSDDTQRIIGERQLSLLRDLAARTAEARTIDEVCELSAISLDADRRDLPFALIYQVSKDGNSVELSGLSGIPAGHPAAPAYVRLDDPAPYPFAEAVRNGTPQLLDAIPDSLCPLPTGAWDRAPQRVVVLPIAQTGQAGRQAVLVAGLNPYRIYDDLYGGFLGLVAGQIGAAFANAQAYEEERRRAEALAELDRSKTLFFSNISHEFRTPLMLMLGPVEDALADKRESLGPNQRERLTLLHRNGLRLLKLVNTLLEFSRIEAGRVQARFELTDLPRYTAELASVFRSAIEKAGMELVIDCPPLPYPVYVDRDMWEQIVLNLISNAFKNTFQGRITVALDAQGLDTPYPAARLRVIDTGTGIPADQVDLVFERFHRVQGARGRTHEGTGIGLALVQELSRLHGGTVGVESAENSGSTFTVAIPFGKAHLPAEQVGTGQPTSSTSLRGEAFVGEALRWLPESAVPDSIAIADDRNQGLLSVFSHPAPGYEHSRILLADDNADMRDYVARLLRENYTVEVVANGREALEAARRRRPDLLLTDVMMPEMDGFGLLREIRNDPSLTTLPVVMVSARAGEEATIEGLAAGADDYLVKPFTARELNARIAGSLKLARLRHEALSREQQLRAEAEEVRERLTDVLENIGEGFVSFDHDWRYLYVNRTAAAMAELRVEDFAGKTIWNLFPQVTGTLIETELRRAGREAIPVRFEYYYEPLNRWIEFHAYPHKKGITVFLQDVSSKKRLEEQLRHTAKLESLGVLAGGVAHDFNNLLVGILGNTSLAHDMLPPTHPVSPILMDAICASERAADLTRQLLAYSGKGRFVVEPIDLAAFVRQNLVLLHSSIGRNVELVLQMQEQLPPIEADRAQFQQIVMNLLINAAEAIGGKPGRVTICGFRRTIDAGEIALRAFRNPITPGEYVSLEITDTGCGMTPQVMERVFDPFFTTKFTGRGLGLAAVLGIVRGHNGDIQVESTVGRGTTFRLILPAASMPVPQVTRNAKQVSTPEGATILIVDDEETVRRMATTALERKGHRVLYAANGKIAVDLLRTAVEVSLIVLDVTMPVMTGEQALPLLKQLRPDVPIILSSGYSEADITLRFPENSVAGFLQKPYGAQSLIEKVAQTLSRPVAGCS